MFFDRNSLILIFYISKISKNKKRQLVEKEDVALNIRDKWDSTPLYYACLCGHLELVEFLLANGNIFFSPLIKDFVN